MQYYEPGFPDIKSVIQHKNAVQIIRKLVLLVCFIQKDCIDILRAFYENPFSFSIRIKSQSSALPHQPMSHWRSNRIQRSNRKLKKSSWWAEARKVVWLNGIVVWIVCLFIWTCDFRKRQYRSGCWIQLLQGSRIRLYYTAFIDMSDNYSSVGRRWSHSYYNGSDSFSYIIKNEIVQRVIFSHFWQCIIFSTGLAI